MFLSFRTIFLFILIISTAVSLTFAQNVTVSKQKNDKDKKEEKSSNKQQNLDLSKLTGEQVAESVIFVYGGLLGRESLNQIRKTTFERGKIHITESAGKTETAN